MLPAETWVGDQTIHGSGTWVLKVVEFVAVHDVLWLGKVSGLKMGSL